MAKPPLCKVCGHAHWATEDHVLDGSKLKSDLASLAAEIVRRAADWAEIKPVTNVTPTVTKPVTQSVTSQDVTPTVTLAMQKEIEMQAAEIARLKRALAEAHGGKPKAKPMTAAERVAKHRAKQKENGNGTP